MPRTHALCLAMALAACESAAQLAVEVGSPTSPSYNVTVAGRTWLPSAGELAGPALARQYVHVAQWAVSDCMGRLAVVFCMGQHGVIGVGRVADAIAASLSLRDANVTVANGCQNARYFRLHHPCRPRVLLASPKALT